MSYKIRRRNCRIMIDQTDIAKPDNFYCTASTTMLFRLLCIKCANYDIPCQFLLKFCGCGDRRILKIVHSFVSADWTLMKERKHENNDRQNTTILPKPCKTTSLYHSEKSDLPKKEKRKKEKPWRQPDCRLQSETKRKNGFIFATPCLVYFVHSTCHTLILSSQLPILWSAILVIDW